MEFIELLELFFPKSVVFFFKTSMKKDSFFLNEGGEKIRRQVIGECLNLGQPNKSVLKIGKFHSSYVEI